MTTEVYGEYVSLIETDDNGCIRITLDNIDAAVNGSTAIIRPADGNTPENQLSWTPGRSVDFFMCGPATIDVRYMPFLCRDMVNFASAGGESPSAMEPH